jgi:hypothetical protein
MNIFELVLFTIALGAPLTSDEPVIEDAALTVKFIKSPVFAKQSKGKHTVMVQGRIMSSTEIYVYISMVIIFGGMAIMII